ncbi:DUF3820 family protein [Leeuwenhoekiella aequorea]|uniref:DUF3820 family protein n=1 Tax=Leeuwenhoekiella aequorea TaxID=283736 RepID=A0A4Q0PDX7_9FLAO|nr:DUF3820 family protein [Leeuwenhoekiella aequorea]RXG24941.1 hypothetical protein DSM00_737 [Leeuwenhoekiella aequorea]
MNPENLIELAHYKMPFGKYQDRYLVDLPEYYYTWFKQKGFPEGKLGMMMQQMYEIKVNGLEELIYKIKSQYPAPKLKTRPKK